jgi:DNA uptake protein ComE-like DNA-binding protein
MKSPSNGKIAAMMNEIAGLLEIQHANPFRIKAYRSAATHIRNIEVPLSSLVHSGDGEELQSLPTIGESLAALVEEIVKTGKSQLLLRLKGQVTPEEVFEQVPGIGQSLATRLVRDLDIKTLEDLELAAHDGRLASIPGFGKRRVEAIRMVLAGLLSSAAQRRLREEGQETARSKRHLPGIRQLLSVDETYRKKAAAGTLKTIAPKRFNPGNKAWLPVMHSEEDHWSFTALFSNTARAHELGKTHDWVVIFFEKNGDEGQCTVVTETHGPLEGKRVVRGREAECMALLV